MVPSTMVSASPTGKPRALAFQPCPPASNRGSAGVQYATGMVHTQSVWQNERHGTRARHHAMRTGPVVLRPGKVTYLLVTLGETMVHFVTRLTDSRHSR